MEHSNTPKAPKAAKTQEFELVRGFWDAEGNRHIKGTIVTLSADDALEGVESGALKRVKK